MNNFEKIKNMTLDEMAAFQFIEFYIKQKDGKIKTYYVSYSGKPCDSLNQLKATNKQWLQAESDG